jgi:putative copper export protein
LATTYGRLLSLKNSLFMVTISFAAWNLLWLVPRLESSSLRLKRTVTLEIALAAGIILG